ncbi:hypothetical protein [Paenibacillus alkalitolerans]|uniref:hypothetical protein n=1 Tax=Paenibacillus alkalitolerans TaxID=2799335 RepID=UPI003898DE39
MHTPEDALEALQSGIPIIAIGRQLIMEPEWSELILQGREEKIRTTLSMNDQQALNIPDPMWSLMMSIPGWFPIDTRV